MDWIFQFASAIAFVHRLFCGRHVAIQGSAQINFMLLLLNDDCAQGLAQGEFAHRLCLEDTLAITPDRFTFVL